MLSKTRSNFKSISCYFACCFISVIAQLACSYDSFSQDIIYKTDNTIIESKIQEVGDVEIRYKKFSNLNGPTFVVKKEDITMIVYENGEKELFNQLLNKQKVITSEITPVIDSIAYIENYLGVRFQKSSSRGGGVKIISIEKDRKLKKGVSAAEIIVSVYTGGIGFAVMGALGEFSLRNATIIAVGVREGKNEKWNYVNNLSDFSKVFFEDAKNKNKNGSILLVKIKKGLGSTKGKADITLFDANPSEFNSIEQARKYILDGKINEAIASYAQLLKKDSANADLLAEDAYALALGRYYDAALLRLDHSWNLGVGSSDINYFAGQIFALMGCDDITNELWISSDKYKAPTWIASKAASLLEKYKTKISDQTLNQREELIASFKLANELAAQNKYLQSIALFHKIITLYPNEFLPYIGYSITLEKTGALLKSAQVIEKAISLVGNNADDKEKKQLLEQRLLSVKQKIALMPQGTMPGLMQSRVLESATKSQMLAYAGGMISRSSTSLNFRLGRYISESSNMSLDFGKMKNSDISYSNLGFSIYNRKNNFVSGAGLLMSSSNGSSDFYLKFSVGYSKMNKSRTSSLDIFLDVNTGMKRGALSTYGISIGKSIYFGKRK